MLATRMRQAAAGGGVYLFRDDFTTTEAAPMASPRTAEPGPGTWSTINTFPSISGGVLSVPANGDMTTGSFAREAGTVVVFDVVSHASGNNTILYGAADTRIDDRAAILNLPSFTLTGSTGDTTAGRNYFVRRPSGTFYIIGDAIQYAHHIAGTSPDTTRIFGLPSLASPITFNSVRSKTLSGTWATDGILDNNFSGSVSAGQTFTHSANFLLYTTVDTLPAAGEIIIGVRKQDANNMWQLRVDSSGNMTLVQLVAGTPTVRATIATNTAAGRRIGCMMDSTISLDRIYAENGTSSKGAAYDITTLTTETAGEVVSLGTGGAISDLHTMPKYLTGAALAALEAV